MDPILNTVVFVAVILAAYGLSYWAFRARTDRSAYVGLYLLFGFPALLLVVWGLALLANQGSGLELLAIGLALGLPLVPSFRRLVAALTPMDPTSPVDMTGLAVMLGAVVVSALGFAAADTDLDADVTAVGIPELIITVLTEVGLAYAAVGLGFFRTFPEANRRLGLVAPTWRTLGVAVGFVILGGLVSLAANILTQIFQPSVYAEIEGVMEDLTAEVQNPLGALILGVSAGVGEELLLRGAFQPRFGIVLTALAFALLHTQYGISFVIVGIFGIGILLGIERRYFGTTAAIITHALFNILAVLERAAA